MKETILIKPTRSYVEILGIKNIFFYKDLFFELVSKDIKLRHKQTILGVLWVVFQPLMSTAIFTLLFGILVKIPSGGLPYVIFVFIGLNYWNFFSNTITSTSGCLIGNESLIKKVFFPRIIVPIASVATTLFDLLISSVFMFILVLIYRIPLNFYIIPVFLLSLMLILVTSFGAGLFLSALNVRFRDVRQIIPFFIQILIFLTPVVYPVSIVSPSRQWILAINPLSTAIDMLRLSISNQLSFNYLNISISTVVAVSLLLFGLWYFAKTESTFADII